MGKTATNAFDPLCLDNQLCFALYACSHEVTRRYAPLLAELDLTYTQYIAMMALWESEPLSVKELGERLKLDSGTLTPMLKKMEAKGLVSRCRDAEDERRLVVSLTDKGRDLRESALRVPMEMGKCVDLEPDEAQELQRLLHKVLSSVEDI
jgi:DNA-binding MarR family transcriptional regulator